LTLGGAACSFRPVEAAAGRPREKESALRSVTPSNPAGARGTGLGFALLTAATFALIVLGALVRAHGAGLACPDWPLCFGDLVPRFDFHVAFEWGHRVFAGGIALGFAALAARVALSPALRARIGWGVAAAGVLLATQIVLGGLTVLLGLAPWTVTAHLLVGNAFCATLLLCASALRPRRAAPATALSPAASACVAAVCALLVLQIALGGLVSSQYAGLACADFPTCDGRSFVPELGGLVGLHVVHRMNGYALLLAIGALAWATRGVPAIGTLARTALRLVLLQVVVGVANVLLRLPVELTALHTALAAALVLVTAQLARHALAARGAVASAGDARIAEAA
jgi:cytochrome c oxidase assembly protein subunit 15